MPASEPDNLSGLNAPDEPAPEAPSIWRRLWRVAELLIAIFLLLMLIELSLIWMDKPEGEFPEVHLVAPKPAVEKPKEDTSAKPTAAEYMAKTAKSPTPATETANTPGGTTRTRRPVMSPPAAAARRSPPASLLHFDQLRHALSSVLIAGSAAEPGESAADPVASINGQVQTADAGANARVALPVTPVVPPTANTNKAPGIRIGVPD